MIQPRHPVLAAALLASTLLLADVGCRAPARVAAAPVRVATPREEYCWWTVFRTTQPADSVAARFARAFASVGLTGTTWARSADTAWAQAGLTALGERYGNATATARVVAYRRGDSTLFRHFVGVARVPTDSMSDGGRRIALCGDLGRAAQVGGTAAPDTTGEERRDVWRARR